MTDSETRKRLSALSDAGLFERLATAVLRESDSRCRLLVHSGVNTDGKPIKSPLDGIAFIPHANPPHLIAVHHTVCSRKELERKWLHDPSHSIYAGKPSATPAGDLVKTARIVQAERNAMPSLQATLILTTNQDPPEKLVRAVNAAARKASINVEIWSGSGIAHFLDADPTGQWIRQDFIGVTAKRLSTELMSELSRLSLKHNHPLGPDEQWVSRDAEKELAQLARGVTFVVGDSGHGKTVICFRQLTRTVEAGGYGLVLSHAAIAHSQSLDQAVEFTLTQLHPGLAPGSGALALAFGTTRRRLHLLVEDVNRSGQPAVLIEKIASWGKLINGKNSDARGWQLYCPVWPRTLKSLREEVQKQVETMSLSLGSFTPEEGGNAVRVRYAESGRSLTLLEAQAISTSLGNDPLLIALHDRAESTEPARVIARFFGGSLARLATEAKHFTEGEYLQTLLRLGSEMLMRRQFDLSMHQAASWFADHPDGLAMIRQIVNFGELISASGSSSTEKLVFRHDRVRDHLLAASIASKLESVNSDILAEPYYADIVGAAIAQTVVSKDVIERVKELGPLAFVSAFKVFGEPTTPTHHAILSAIDDWITDQVASSPNNGAVLEAALQILSETTSARVIPCVALFKSPRDWWALWARARNGDVLGAIELCSRHEPGVGLVGFDELLHHIRERHAATVPLALDAHLREGKLTTSGRSGALRLAGHLADPRFADAIGALWQHDVERETLLADYLWASAKCCGDNPARLLGPVCDMWANLPDKADKEGHSSPRDNLASHGVRWAFHRNLPAAAVRFFVERASRDDLRWQITYMLHGVDDPDAIAFVVREIADQEAQASAKGSFSHFAISAGDEWTRRQETTGKGMSQASRTYLLRLWQDISSSVHIRKSAFRLWAATRETGDSGILKTLPVSDILADYALRARLQRQDIDAIPLLLQKLSDDEGGRWWQCGRTIWSHDLTLALGRELFKRDTLTKRDWKATYAERNDWIIYELLMRLPLNTAEQIMLQHWPHLRYSLYYVQTALYLATPPLLQAAREAISECPNPKELLQHIGSHFGFNTRGHPGVTRLAQVEALLPYLEYLSDFDIWDLGEICNKHGWYEFRRVHFDSRAPTQRRYRFTDDSAAIAELNREHVSDHHIWMDHWVDSFLAYGVSVDHVVDVLRRWLAQKNDAKALRIAADALVHIGRREFLEILNSAQLHDTAVQQEVIARATFWTKHRSLN